MEQQRKKSMVALVNEEIDRQLHENSVKVDFPAEFYALSEKDFEKTRDFGRADYRNLNTFTLDCSDCQDMDDALSLEVTDHGYVLGIHIADVSSFVTPYSSLDDDAVERATSIYLPSRTIPMLPPVLTNDLCSLMEGKDRKTMSVMVSLDNDANVLDYEISRAAIRSRIKGSYDDVNALLAGTASSQTVKKYACVLDDILTMSSLAQKMRNQRAAAGANMQNNSVPQIEIADDRVIVTPHTNGEAELMVEEFMILANRLVAEFMIVNELPTIFRVQEEKDRQAEYRFVLCHHAELALDAYVHFTAPIRRYADIVVHRVLGYYLDGYTVEEIRDLFEDEDPEYVCDQVTRKSRRAANLSLACNRFCYAQYFNWRRSERFSGTVTAYDRNHRPLITLDAYNIIVVGDAAIGRFMGQAVSFNISVDNKRALKAFNTNLIAA